MLLYPCADRASLLPTPSQSRRHVISEQLSSQASAVSEDGRREMTPREQEVEEETAEMSQIIWDSDPLMGSQDLLLLAGHHDSSLWGDDSDSELLEKLVLDGGDRPPA